MKKKTKIGVLILFLTSLGAYGADTPKAAVFNVGPEQQSGGNVNWPIHRFVGGSGVQSNCVTDTLTGLMWVRNLNTVPIPKAKEGSLTSWTAANNVATIMNKGGVCGFKDWRLPNVTELKSLVNYATAENSNA